MRDVAKSIKEEFLSDLNFVSVSWSRTMFYKVLNLFEKKWREFPQAGPPLNKLKNFWITKSQRLVNFYRGAAEGYVMNNNGIEATNKQLKDYGTLQKKFEFFPQLFAVFYVHPYYS